MKKPAQMPVMDICRWKIRDQGFTAAVFENTYCKDRGNTVRVSTSASRRREKEPKLEIFFLKDLNLDQGLACCTAYRTSIR
jgi:hypothetical protein